MWRNSQRTHQGILVRFEGEAGSGTKASFLPSAKVGHRGERRVGLDTDNGNPGRGSGLWDSKGVSLDTGSVKTLWLPRRKCQLGLGLIGEPQMLGWKSNRGGPSTYSGEEGHVQGHP